VAASEDIPPYIFSMSGISAADMPTAYASFGRRPMFGDVADNGVQPDKRAEVAGIIERMWSFSFVFHVEVFVVVLE
jgi:hypothetical protein